MLDIQYHFMAYLSFLCLKTHFLQGWRHRRGGVGGPFPSPIFWVAKRKEGNKEKKESVSKQKLLKAVTKVKMLLFCHSRSSRIQKFFLSKRNVMADNTFLRQPFFKNVFLFSTIYYFRTKLKNPHHRRFLSLSFFTVLLPFPFSEFFLFTSESSSKSLISISFFVSLPV